MRLLVGVLGLLAAPAWGGWPDLSRSPGARGGGENDAALIVGIEKYAAVPPIAGAVRNAQDWYAFFANTLKVPPSQLTLLRDNEGTKEKMRKFAAAAAAAVKPGGTLWFVYIGHGAPARDGTDGVLVGFDAQQDADSLYERSVPQKEMLGLLKAGAQEKTVAIIDACFSGR